MKQRAHAWTALRALKLLDDSRKVPKLVEFYYHTTCLMSEKGLGAFEWLKEQSEIKVIPKVSRNDLCPCGSGKKYKKCCGVYS